MKNSEVPIEELQMVPQQVSHAARLFAESAMEHGVPLTLQISLLKGYLAKVYRKWNLTAEHAGDVVGRQRGFWAAKKSAAELTAEKEYRGQLLAAEIFDEVVTNPDTTCEDLSETLKLPERKIRTRLNFLVRSRQLIASVKDGKKSYRAVSRHYEHPNPKSLAQRQSRCQRLDRVVQNSVGAVSFSEQLGPQGIAWLKGQLFGSLENIPTRRELVSLEDQSLAADPELRKYTLSTSLVLSKVSQPIAAREHAKAAIHDYCGHIVPPCEFSCVHPDTARLRNDEIEIFTSQTWSRLVAEIEGLLQAAATKDHHTDDTFQVSLFFAKIGL